MKAELNEQILEDGAHFELSPMYHVIILQRLLDGFNLLQNNEHQLHDILQQIEKGIQKMINWLDAIMFSNGDIPMLNDSTNGQALDPVTVINYAKQFGFTPQQTNLKESGYRKIQSGNFELIADVGEVGPSYQPGHSHSDTLSFVLYHSIPIIVDRGLQLMRKTKLEKMKEVLLHITQS